MPADTRLRDHDKSYPRLKLPRGLSPHRSEMSRFREELIQHNVSVIRFESAMARLSERLVHGMNDAEARVILLRIALLVHLETLVEAVELADELDLPNDMCLAMMKYRDGERTWTSRDLQVYCLGRVVPHEA